MENRHLPWQTVTNERKGSSKILPSHLPTSWGFGFIACADTWRLGWCGNCEGWWWSTGESPVGFGSGFWFLKSLNPCFGWLETSLEPRSFCCSLLAVWRRKLYGRDVVVLPRNWGSSEKATVWCSRSRWKQARPVPHGCSFVENSWLWLWLVLYFTWLDMAR